MSSTAGETALLRDAPAMPDQIDAILREEWSKLDPDADRMMAFFKECRAFHALCVPPAQHLGYAVRMGDASGGVPLWTVPLGLLRASLLL